MSGNIVQAMFRFGRNAAQTRPMWQWDYGIVLQFDGIELPLAYTVHFSNQRFGGEAFEQVGNADGVAVPDALFETGLPVYAWVYLHTGEDDGETVYSVMIPVNKRPKPTNETPTPAQQSVIDEAIIALNGGVAAAEAAAALLEHPGAHAETLPAGSAATADYEDGVFSFGIPQGEPAVIPTDRVSSLTDVPLSGAAIIEAVGIPVYVSDVSQYAAYGLTETGWYVFARVNAPAGVTLSGAPAVTGAAGSKYAAGTNYVDVAVRFGVVAASQTVTINWGAETESFVFKATDLAVRNLDYRTTFYLYDLAPYAAWEYALTADTTFAEGKNYYTEEGGVYTLAEVTAGDAVPESPAYYNHSKLTLSGMTRNVTYRLNEMVDCPIEIVLPEITDDGYGAWFEMQLRYNGSYSCTLTPPSASVKVGTANTQGQTAGINVIDLQYSDVGGAQLWTLLNTHSNIPE